VVFVGEWKTTVCAYANLRFVDINKDSGMSQWSSTSITFHNTLVCPSYRLLVDQANSCFGSWLSLHNRLFESRSRHSLRPRILTPRPNRSSIRRLHHAPILSLFNTLLQSFILVVTLNWQLVRLRNVWNLLWLVWIVDFLLIIRGECILAPGRNLHSS